MLKLYGEGTKSLKSFSFKDPDILQEIKCLGGKKLVVIVLLGEWSRAVFVIY